VRACMHASLCVCVTYSTCMACAIATYLKGTGIWHIFLDPSDAIVAQKAAFQEPR